MDGHDKHCAERVRERDFDRYLATLYAPAPSRAGLFALHALDLELAEVARTTTEPMLGQIRLAWWREQLQGLDAGPHPPQPVLAALAEHALPRGVSGASLEPLEDANLALLEKGDLQTHALARGRLFGAAVRLLVPNPDPDLVAAADRLGAGWAAVEALCTGQSPADEAAAAQVDALLAPAASPPAARSVLALAALARRDLAALRRVGFDSARLDRRRGAPGRQARLLWSIVTGR